MSEILKINHLRAAYIKKKEIIHDISFSVNEGEVLGIAGESGSGKSTVAKAILGMVKHTSGEIDRNYNRARMVFQDPYQSLNPAKSISFILEEPLKLIGVKDKSTRLEKVKDMMKKASLDEELLDRKPMNLSGGQRQRISIITSLMQDPDFLVADEPVSALDVTIQEQIINLLSEFKKERNLSIMFISHDLRTMYNFCDRIVIVKDGVIQEVGNPKEMYRNPKSEYTKHLLESAGII